jgi:hypothetical protein
MSWKHGPPRTHCLRCRLVLVPEAERRPMEGSAGIGCRACNAAIPTAPLPPANQGARRPRPW